MPREMKPNWPNYRGNGNYICVRLSVHTSAKGRFCPRKIRPQRPCDNIQSSFVFYKRQLWTYNLGVYSCGTESDHMHLWHKRMASRGSPEIASCILRVPQRHQSNSNPSNHLQQFMWWSKQKCLPSLIVATHCCQ